MPLFLLFKVLKKINDWCIVCICAFISFIMVRNGIISKHVINKTINTNSNNNNKSELIQLSSNSKLDNNDDDIDIELNNKTI